MTCTFFGHRDTPAEIEGTLRTVLTDLIENKNVDTFYVGNSGNFDLIVQYLLAELSVKYHVKYYVILAYFPKSEIENPPHGILPEGIETVPLRFAIDYRNKFMIEKSDYVITRVTHSWGGAAKYKKLAEKNGKTIIECDIQSDIFFEHSGQ